jgi:hypothetical protein
VVNDEPGNPRTHLFASLTRSSAVTPRKHRSRQGSL